MRKNALIFRPTRYILISEDCSRPTTVERFHSAQREWCKKADQYKTNLSKWQRENDENECPRVPSQLKTTTGGKHSFI
jgi:hypothetical protein